MLRVQVLETYDPLRHTREQLCVTQECAWEGREEACKGREVEGGGRVGAWAHVGEFDGGCEGSLVEFRVLYQGFCYLKKPKKVRY